VHTSAWATPQTLIWSTSNGPPGIVQELTNLASKQFLTVTESGFGIASQPQNLGVFPGGNITEHSARIQ
jgi:hypothetical protein